MADGLALVLNGANISETNPLPFKPQGIIKSITGVTVPGDYLLTDMVNVGLPKYTIQAWTTNGLATGAITGIVQGSFDGVNWFTISIVSSAGFTTQVVFPTTGSAYVCRYFRLHLSAVTLGAADSLNYNIGVCA